MNPLSHFIPHRSVYAISIMHVIAEAGSPITSKSLSIKYNLQKRFFEVILANLAEANLISGLRGPRGGYVIKKQPEEISYADIISATNSLEDTGIANNVKPILVVLNAAIKQKLTLTKLKTRGVGR